MSQTSLQERERPSQTRRLTIPAAEEILGGYFPVLDHGFVALVDYMGSDDAIEQAARVSYGAGTRRRSETRGLIRYLARHAHTTPSEMVEFKFHCAMPIFIARQWIRHRTASVNELSARYSILPLLFYTPPHQQLAQQSTANNQGRGDEPVSADLHREAVDRWNTLRENSAHTYGWLLERDIARELARMDLPLSVYTSWYWKIDLHNLLHFLTLRVDPHAQWEIREYGKVIAGMLQRVAPLAYEAWLDYRVLGSHLSAAERAALAELVRPDNNTLRSTGDSLDVNQLAAHGLSKREIREFLGKLTVPERPDYALDLSAMRSAEDVRRETDAAVPSRTGN